MKTSSIVVNLIILMLLAGCANTVVYRLQPDQILPMSRQEARDNFELALSISEKGIGVQSVTMEGEELIARFADVRCNRRFGYDLIPHEITKEGKYFVVHLVNWFGTGTRLMCTEPAGHYYFKSEKDAKLFVDSGYILKNQLFADQGKGIRKAVGATRPGSSSVSSTAKAAEALADSASLYKTPEKTVASAVVEIEKPVITVISPDPGRTVKESTITVSGLAKSKAGIADVFINDQQATLDENGQFTADILLKIGLNEIRITALDIRKNQSTKQLTIRRAKSVPAKKTPSSVTEAKEKQIPGIVITSPDITRSVSITARQNFITVSGQVESKAGVVDVTVNGQQADLDDKGFFSANVPLKVGQNEITVKAIDVFKNEGSKVFVLNRASGHVTQAKPPAETSENAFESARYYALVIAIQSYESPEIAKLDYPVTDANRLIDTLVTHYTFERENVRFLQNPDRRTLYRTLQEMKYQLTDKDNLLIFYAGHGYWVEDMKEGFWLPRDAAGINDPSDWVPNSTIRNYIKSIRAKHILVIADACFSGGIFKTRDLRPPRQISIEKIYELPSRKAITSGAMKTVPDRSVFLEYLLKRLTSNKETYLDTQKLFANLREAVINNSPSNQTPLYGAIAEVGDEGGDFIFVKRP